MFVQDDVDDERYIRSEIDPNYPAEFFDAAYDLLVAFVPQDDEVAVLSRQGECSATKINDAKTRMYSSLNDQRVKRFMHYKQREQFLRLKDEDWACLRVQPHVEGLLERLTDRYFILMLR